MQKGVKLKFDCYVSMQKCAVQVVPFIGRLASVFSICPLDKSLDDVNGQVVPCKQASGMSTSCLL